MKSADFMSTPPTSCQLRRLHSYPYFIMASMVEEGSNAELLMSRHSRQAAIKGCSCNYGEVRIYFGVGSF
jgi:hypothetical protein